MEGLRQYVISVTAAAWIVGCASGFVHDQAGKAMVRLIGGIFLTFTLLTPLSDMNLDDLLTHFMKEFPEKQSCVDMGKEISREALSSVIVSKTEAYILDKAKTLGADIAVSIQLSNDEIPVPYEARLQGTVPLQVRQVLSDHIEHELGITKENQIWIS